MNQAQARRSCALRLEVESHEEKAGGVHENGGRVYVWTARCSCCPAKSHDPYGEVGPRPS